MAVPTLRDFEKEAEKLLKDGGTRNKDFSVISAIQKVIDHQIDTHLENLFT